MACGTEGFDSFFPVVAAARPSIAAPSSNRVRASTRWDWRRHALVHWNAIRKGDARTLRNKEKKAPPLSRAKTKKN